AEPPVEHGLRLATHEAGLMDAPEAVRIVSERAAAAATNPTTESLLIIARGMEDDAEDAAVVAAMNEAARAIGDVGFARIGTATLREDWPAERAVAEQRILDFVRFETSLGRRVIVLPYRLDRFGAAADALGASDYVATDGLLPHPAVTAWIERTAAEIACREGWTPADACAAAPARAGTP
ncbi:MAG TPA: hypothetical protein VFQ22_07250, partial [Longimicrobiales bacterium]|nr:hypothetical protein [Longimicrobiales bacterium]